MADGGSLELDVNQPQGQFISLDRRFRAYVGGFGSGKTYVGCISLCNAAYRWHGIPQGYFAPTYGQIRDIFYPTIEEVAERMGLNCTIKRGDHEVVLSSGRRERSRIICRSMEHPERIVGFKIGRALVDEMDTLAKVKAFLAWRKIIARMRWKGPQGFNAQVDVTTTPEGFGFVYEQFVKQLIDKPHLNELYGIVHASTYANELNLPPGYIESLRESYPEQLIQAYLEGKFVNLTSGSVYPHYDRAANRCRDKVEGLEPVHIGMDFNVNNMSAIIHVTRDGEPRAVGEITKGRDTPSVIETIRQMFWKYDQRRGTWDQNRTITIYPDASGNSSSTKDASKSDIALLRAAGFQVSAPPSNPPVRDRVLAMNMAFCNSKGHRMYLVNDDLAPTYAQNLEQQCYSPSGEPDKAAGTDHTNDAGGYYIHRRYPIIRPVSSLNLNRAH